MRRSAALKSRNTRCCRSSAVPAPTAISPGSTTCSASDHREHDAAARCVRLPGVRQPGCVARGDRSEQRRQQGAGRGRLLLAVAQQDEHVGDRHRDRRDLSTSLEHRYRWQPVNHRAEVGCIHTCQFLRWTTWASSSGRTASGGLTRSRTTATRRCARSPQGIVVLSYINERIAPIGATRSFAYTAPRPDKSGKRARTTREVGCTEVSTSAYLFQFWEQLMRLAGTNVAHKFSLSHPSVRDWLKCWRAEVQAASWQSPQDIKQRYPTASFLPNNFVVFNVKGNEARMLLQVSYKNQVVLMKWIGLHAAYSKIDWENFVNENRRN